MNNITINKLINYFLLISSALLGYFTFTDLQISIELVNKSTGWANFLERFGEIPGLLVLLAGIHIYLSEHLSKLKLRKVVVTLFSLAAASYIFRYLLIVIYVGITGSIESLESYKLIITIFSITANTVVAIFLSKKQFTESVKLFSKSSVLLGLYGYLLLVQPFKILWGRVRFRDLDPLYSNFTNWFTPNGINGNDSFPSGHSALAWMLLPTLFLVINKRNSVKTVTFLLITIWGISVGLSRIVVGAHYASDVVFGASVIILLFSVFCKRHYFNWQIKK